MYSKKKTNKTVSMKKIIGNSKISKINRITEWVESKYKIILAVISLVAFLIYFLLNLQFSGPTYLSDEIGYLSKATFFSGHNIDLASSWHGGYSLLIAPIFFIVSDPSNIWTAITLLNSLLLSASLILIFVLLRIIYPSRSKLQLLAVVLLSAFYPSFIVMSGYAFSAPLFIFMFILTLIFLAKSKLQDNKYLTLFSITVGLLYWVHPTAIGPVAVSLLLLSTTALSNRSWKISYRTMVTLIIVLLYAVVIDPWLANSMTPDNFVPTKHYAETLPAFFRFTELSFITRWFVMAVGQMSYMIIATFGFIAIAFYSVFSLVWRNKLKINTVIKKLGKSTEILVMFYAIISLIVVLLISSAIFANLQGELGVHYWMYGRYIDQFIVPLFAIVLIEKYQKKHIFISVLILATSTLLLSILVNPTTTNLAFSNLINVQAFWPQSLVSQTNIILWFILSILLIVMLGFLYRRKKATVMVVVIPLYIVSINTQFDWHKSVSLLPNHLESSLYRYVRDSYSNKECIGINYEAEIYPERYKLYSFYLYEYDYERLSIDDWVVKCEAPYLTFEVDERILNNELVNGHFLNVIGREVPSGLFLVGKNSPDTKIINRFSEDDGFIYDNKDYYKITTKLMRGYSNVGNFYSDKIYTTNAEGYLLFGPAMPIEKGRFKLKFNLENFGLNDSARIDVVTELGNVKYLDRVVKDKITEFEFELDKDVLDLEVRIKTDSISNFGFESYELIRVN